MTSYAAVNSNPSTFTLDPAIPSVGHMLRRRIAATPHRRAYSYPSSDSTWDALTWAELGEHAAVIGAGLISLGVAPEDRVAIACSTRIEWALANYGIMDASAATVTVYPTTIAEDVQFILDDSDACVVFVEDDEQLEKVSVLRSRLPKVSHVILLTGERPANVDTSWVLTLSELRDRGAQLLREQPSIIDDRIDATRVDHLATLIYTSGTTGRPKGVRLPHRVWVFEAQAAEISAKSSGAALLTIDDKQFLWLPLAHVMGKLLLVLPLHFGFETAIDGRIDRIVTNLAEVHPTFMGSAPRVFEKAFIGVEALMTTKGGVTEKLYRWAVRNCETVFNADYGDGKAGPWTRVKATIGDRLVMSKIRARFGGEVRYFLSGSAALTPQVSQWFGAVGMPILEGYGLTETSAGSCLTQPALYRTGYVGRPLVGMEARIAEDGEIMLRGPAVMDGYHNNPEATAEVFTHDGWFHTGDIGEIDAEGRVRVTDRKKELFKTSNGKYVAPAPMEARFRALCPLASQMVVIGNNRKYASALITLDETALTAWAEKAGTSSSYHELLSSPEIHTLVQRHIDELNSTLNQWERIKVFTILPRDLSIEHQEITPSLKLRRAVIAAHFTSEIEAMYPAS